MAKLFRLRDEIVPPPKTKLFRRIWMAFWVWNEGCNFQNAINPLRNYYAKKAKYFVAAELLRFKNEIIPPNFLILKRNNSAVFCMGVLDGGIIASKLFLYAVFCSFLQLFANIEFYFPLKARPFLVSSYVVNEYTASCRNFFFSFQRTLKHSYFGTISYKILFSI